MSGRLTSWLFKYKRGLFCMDCGMSFKDRPECCDFHHRDPATKSGAVSSFTSTWAMKAEIEKCDPLCACCHRTRHANAVKPAVISTPSLERHGVVVGGEEAPF
jgi:hypothetical protein